LGERWARVAWWVWRELGRRWPGFRGTLDLAACRIGGSGRRGSGA
jgi:hypothetical protein